MYIKNVKILTPNGEINIDKLKSNHYILNRNGKRVKIKQVYKILVDSNEFIIFKANSISSYMPFRNTICYNSNCIVDPINNGLVPCYKLINNNTIKMYRTTKYKYVYNIELLEPKETFIANGLINESMNSILYNYYGSDVNNIIRR